MRSTGQEVASSGGSMLTSMSLELRIIDAAIRVVKG